MAYFLIEQAYSNWFSDMLLSLLAIVRL